MSTFMKAKVSLFISIIALLCPLISTIIALQIEEEFIEALFSGILVGCIFGSIFGVVAIIMNKNKNKLVMVGSIIPMIPLALYLVLMVPYFFFG